MKRTVSMSYQDLNFRTAIEIPARRAGLNLYEGLIIMEYLIVRFLFFRTFNHPNHLFL